MSWLQNFHREKPQDTEAIIGDNVEVACRVSFFTSQISRIGEFFGGNNELVGRVSFILFKFNGLGKFWGQFGSSLQAEFYPSQISRIGDVLGEIRN